VSELTFLRSVLAVNRSAAFARLRDWAAAVADAEEGVEAKVDFAKAHCRLGVALLGSRQCEKAYTHFTKSLLLRDEYPEARRGRNECLAEMLRYRSIRAEARRRRRFMDAKRPKGTTRVFAISDVHFDHRSNEDWAHEIDEMSFQEDVLIVAGNLASTKVAVVRGLTTLRSKFRRVFYTVGNHEMWVHCGEADCFPDSIAKLQGIFEACDELGIDVVADAVCEGLFIAPLHSWYNAEFDARDPWPDPKEAADPQCRWPMDPEEQVWKFMLKLNEASFDMPFHGTILTFSQFLPRRGLPIDPATGSKTQPAKTSGCERIDDQVRAVRSQLHVFGHGCQKHVSHHNGVTYVRAPIGLASRQLKSCSAFKTEEKMPPPMLQVYNGRATCARPWSTMKDAPH